MTIEGESTFILTKEAGEYFEVDETTNTIWNLMDGRKSVNQIYEETKKIDEKITEKDVRDAVVSLAQEGLIASTEPEIEEKRVEMVSAFQLDIRLVRDSSKALGGFFRITRKIIRKEELLIGVGIVVLGVILFGGNSLQILSNPSRLQILGSTLLGLLFYQEIILLPVYLIHELAHAAACDYYGGKPRELGTGLYYFATFFYCDTSDSWRLERRARIMISVAGPLSTLVIGSLLVFAGYFANPGFGRNALEVSAFFCFYGTLANFSPFIETDGYYILSDILKIPNLRDESFAYIKRAFLRIIGRPVRRVRYSTSRRRILLIYSIIGVGWLVFFGYTTLTLTYFYSEDAYHILQNLLQIASGIQPLDPGRIGISIAALFYFAFLIVGYLIMGAVAYRKIRIRGVKLETIHDKRVSIFLPLPSFFQRERAMRLVDAAKGASRKFTRSFSVIWEPPICVAALKLGKVDQSLDEMRRDMLSAEKSFKSLHYRFLSKNLSLSSEETPSKKMLRELLNRLAKQFPSFERSEAVKEVSKFLDRQDTVILYLLHSAFGTVWTLELSPMDYKRIRRELFPGLIAEDLGVIDLNGELEHFKRHTVLGLDALSKLSSELDQEAGQVSRRPEVYQATAFIEPIKSRLVFVGRTEGVERSIIWLGGLFLYQAWAGYIREALYEAALGLKSISQGSYNSFGKAQVTKLSDAELQIISQNLEQLRPLRKAADEALSRIRSGYQSARNFHESLVSLLDEQNFDVGLYKPILTTNDEQLESVKEKIDKFQEEYGRAFDQLGKIGAVVSEQYSKREVESIPSKRWVPFGIFDIRHRAQERHYTSVYYAQVKLLFAMTRLLYGVVIGSEIII
ncbi:MAG: PqqD family peptide modification chaperone [Nitrososphaerales archaeon]